MENKYKFIVDSSIIGFKERRYIEELRILTKATAIDCLIDDRFERIIYVIKQGDMGLAIGKNGDNIKKMERTLGKRIEMVEYSEDPDIFVANMFKPAGVLKVLFNDGDHLVTVIVPEKNDVGLAIGKSGITIEKARQLIRRFFNKDLVNIHVSGGKNETGDLIQSKNE
ncbi:MAG TPA: NusA-like transcription termination signal-binding factor [Methanocorpusculum sp.]|nr:NusA-like transcription termination signal-binding factor [Methanocorpusculum sp.]